MRISCHVAGIAFFTVLVFGLSQAGCGCTIWASAGETVEGGGAIIAKNRDNTSSLHTRLRLVFPAKGLRFLGILDVEADGYVVAAINEKGLVVVNASANSVPRKKRHVATEDVTERILVTFDSVDALLKEKDLFRKTHPALYIVADAVKIMSVEVTPGGRVSVQVKEKGTLAFTNHYIGEDVVDANERMSRESLLRLSRINVLCGRGERSHTMDDFISMSRDDNGGSPGAVMRRPRKDSRIRTLATWIVRLEPGVSPQLYVHLLNAEDRPRTYTVKLDESFWNPRL